MPISHATALYSHTARCVAVAHDDSRMSITKIRDYRTRLYRARARGLVVLECNAAEARSWLSQLEPCESCLVVSDQLTTSSVAATSAQRFQAFLGSEFELLIWDGFSGFHPNALAALSGTLRAGGLLVVLLPKASDLTHFIDKDSLRLCRPGESLETFKGHFLVRLLAAFRALPHRLVLPLGECSASLLCNTSVIPRQESLVLTEDQKNTVAKIVALANDPEAHPLVLTADRGRGKSSALGIAAATILQAHPQYRIVVCAGKREATWQLEQHFTRCLPHHALPEFMPPDAILAKLPQLDMLMIDEAAALPAPLLDSLIQHYPRTVMASTIHGYEGSGRGFELRFGKALSQRFPKYTHLRMKTPVRWGDHDPLERMIFDVFCLDADIPDNATAVADIELRLLQGEHLASNEPLLQQIVALLVNAHYQTRPDDLRMILDHPRVYCMAALSGRTIVGVALFIEEGRLEDTELMAAIIRGTRRPRGHLVPQLLAHYAGDNAWLRHTSWRIMRIAVHPNAQRQGLGSRLIASVEQQAKHKHVSLLTSSFGYTPSLLAFWQHNGFSPCRLGYHRDAASNSYSLAIAKSLTPGLNAQVHFANQLLGEQLRRARSVLYPLLTRDEMQALERAVAPEPFDLPPHTEMHLLRLCAEFQRNIADTHGLIQRFLSQRAKAHPSTAKHKEPITLLQAAFIKNHTTDSLKEQFGLKGKKDVEQALRAALKEYLDSTAEM
ncbi:MAG: GNAT family N-acetyltransferase [Oleiphilaceae bacterium]|nr:GNAT family N-acetyltransferase [Oleiphilaceae bacterium]